MRKTMGRHFARMEEEGIEGGALQRFATAMRDPHIRPRVGIVRRNVTRPAEAHGRILCTTFPV